MDDRPEDPAGSTPSEEFGAARCAIAAFGGWNDASEGASGAIEHLLSIWPVQRRAVISSEEYVDFQVNRPGMALREDGTQELTWPDTFVDLLQPPNGAPLLVIHGPEPSLRWRRYCAEILEQIRRSGARELLCVGALLADAPHSRPLPVSVTREQLTEDRGDPEGNEGAIGVTTVLARTALAEDIRTTSIWVQVPHYVSQNRSPKASLALLRQIEAVLDISIPLADLETESEAWQRGVDELARHDPDVGEYVARLERAKDAAELPDATGDAIAREFEQFLRRRRDEG